FDAEEVAVGGGPAGGDRLNGFRGLGTPGTGACQAEEAISSELPIQDIRRVVGNSLPASCPMGNYLVSEAPADLEPVFHPSS
ncbi:MAG: hypothetical protein OXF41_19515, partial [bacterium]|nr:hypothetical protein [bacterium]